MIKQQLKNIGIPLLVMLSLFVSSISACACAHHQEQTENHLASCHQSMPEMEMHEDSHGSSTSAEVKAETKTFVSESECSCPPAASRVFVFGENHKIEKQTAEVLSVSKVEFKAAILTVSYQTVYLEPPFYLSDSFHNLSPGRAPPRLSGKYIN